MVALGALLVGELLRLLVGEAAPATRAGKSLTDVLVVRRPRCLLGDAERIADLRPGGAVLAGARDRFSLPGVELSGRGTKTSELSERVVGGDLDLETHLVIDLRRIQSCVHGGSVGPGTPIVKQC